MFAIDLWHKQISMFFHAASCCSATLGYGMASKDHKIVEFYDDCDGNLIGVPTQTNTANIHDEITRNCSNYNLVARTQG